METREINVKLTEEEINKIISELEEVNNSVYTFTKFDKIIEKLKKAKNGS